MKATKELGALNPLNKCQIVIAGKPITIRILPEISDRKSAHYNDEQAIGRASPIKTYSYSDNRTISMKLHFVSLTRADIQTNLEYLRLIQSATYPDETSLAPYIPPPICRLMCGDLFTSGKTNNSISNIGLNPQSIGIRTSGKFVNAILKDYNISYDTSVAWDEETYLPYRFDVDLNFDIVYSNQDLPGSSLIIGDVP